MSAPRRLILRRALFIGFSVASVCLFSDAFAVLKFGTDFESIPLGTTDITPPFDLQQYCAGSNGCSCDNASTEKRQEVVGNKARTGNQSLKLVKYENDTWDYGGGNCTARRNEVMKKHAFNYGDDFWVGYSFYPSTERGGTWATTWNWTATDCEHINQIFSHSATSDPLWFINIQKEGSSYSLAVKGSSTYIIGPMVWDTWHDIVIHLKWLSTGGKVEVWLNGVKKVEQATGYNGVTSGDFLWKFGPYAKKPSPGRPFLCYFDNVRGAVGANEFQTVNPTDAAGTTGTILKSENQTPNLLGVHQNPNSRSGQLTIDFNRQTTHAVIEIRDMRGRLCHRQTAVGSSYAQVNSNLSSGMYLLNVSERNETHSQKFLIK